MSTSTLTLKDGNGAKFTVGVEVDNGVISPHSAPVTGGLPVDGSNPLPVLIAGATGLATIGNQNNANQLLTTLVNNTLDVATATHQINAGLQLTTIAANTAGLATAANQTTANAALASIVSNTTSVSSLATQVVVPSLPSPGPTVYAAKQPVGGLLSFTMAAQSGGSGLLQAVTVTKAAASSPTVFDVLFFDANPTASTITNGQTLTIAAADIGKLIGVVHLTDVTLTSTGGYSVAQSGNLSLPYKLASGTTGYAVVLYVSGDTSYGPGSISVKVGMTRN